jgi:hypothetical protein
MSYPINYPTPQGANVQIFNCISKSGFKYQSWVKPQGASMVWFTLIGGGGGGGGTDGVSDFSGGGAGAVTNFMAPAFLIPDNLSVMVAEGGAGGAAGGNNGGAGNDTSIFTILDGNTTFLFKAFGGGGGTTATGAGGSAIASNFFTAAGFFQSVAGQAGTPVSTPSTSGSTFLQGGGASDYSISNYGYVNGVTSTQGAAGYFQMQPIIVGVGGAGSGSSSTNAGKFIGGIGCGGGGTTAAVGSLQGSAGGNGLAVIITW